MATTFLEPGSDATQDLTFFPNQFLGAATTAASATDQAHTGTRSIKYTATVGSVIFLATSDGIVADAGGAVSFWYRIGTLPAVRTCGFVGMYQTGFGDVPLHLALTPAGTVRLYTQSTAIGVAGTTVLSANTWNRISFAFVITSGTNWTAKVWINGVLELTRTNADATLAITGVSELGLEYDTMSAGNDTITWWYDDIYVDNRTDLTDPGDIRVTAKRPFANGTTNGFTSQIGAGGSGYGSGHAPQVNEQPLSQTNGWSMIGAGSAVTEEYNVEGISVGDVDIRRAPIVDWMGWVFAKSLVSETGKILVNNVQSNISLTSTATLFMAPAGSTSYPPGSGTDIGIVTDTSLTTVSLYECGVLIAFNPPQPFSGRVLDAMQPIRQAGHVSTLPQSLTLAPAIVAPFAPNQWPSPALQQNTPAILTPATLALTTGPVVQPAFPIEWPTPARPISIGVIPIPFNLPLNTASVPAPFAPIGWPTPARQAPSWSSVSYFVQDDNLPFVQVVAWPLLPRPVSNESIAKNWLLQNGFGVVAPFINNPWPTPAPPQIAYSQTPSAFMTLLGSLTAEVPINGRSMDQLARILSPGSFMSWPVSRALTTTTVVPIIRTMGWPAPPLAGRGASAVGPNLLGTTLAQPAALGIPTLTRLVTWNAEGLAVTTWNGETLIFTSYAAPNILVSWNAETATITTWNTETLTLTTYTSS